MNKRALCLAAGMVMACSVLLSAQAAELKQYTFADDGFGIGSPIQPVLERTMQNTDKGRVESHSYTIDLDNSVSCLVYVTDFKGATGLSLPGGRDGFLKNLKARLLSEKAVTLAGSPGIEFEYESAEFHGRAQMFVVRGVMYQLLSIAALKQPIPAVVDSMFQSFRLLEGARP